MRERIWLRFVSIGFCLSIALALGYAPATRAQDVTSDPSCQVTIDSGALEGVLVGQTCKYLGIPYAAPPAGDLRWRPPAPVAPWLGVLGAVNFGNMCPQIRGTTAIGKEDCLTLNVYAPAAPGVPLPVMVYLHGGGNTTNEGERHEGEHIVEFAPVLVVNIEYRLGALGWLAHRALDAESSTNSSGNYGILDQIAALQWVQRNIAVFGGDPGRIMIFGNSAGAADASVLVASPLAKGLFMNAILESALLPPDFSQPTLKEYETAVGVDIVAKLGCATATDIPACLRALPADLIVKTAPRAGSAIKTGGNYSSVVDGYVLNDRVLNTIKERRHNHVPLIIGTTDKESSNPAFTAATDIPTDAAYQAAIYDLFCGNAAIPCEVGNGVLALYPSTPDSTPRTAYVVATTDYRWVCPARRLARAMSHSQKEPVYRYLYTHTLASGPGKFYGAWHGAELMFVFRTFSSNVTGGLYTPTAVEVTLSDEMIGYWSRFAATGDPNGGNAPSWFVYGKNADPDGALFNQSQGYVFFNDTATGDDKKDTFFQFDTPPFGLAEGAGFHAEVCENFWDVLVGDTNNGHGEGSIAADIDENAGNEAFITDADLDNDDQQAPPGN